MAKVAYANMVLPAPAGGYQKRKSAENCDLRIP